MKIKVKLTTESIDSAIQQLEQYAASLEQKSEELVKRLGDYGHDSAANNLGHVDTGETLASLQFTCNGTSGTITVGGAAVWIEFGTGVLKNAGAPHPKRDELGMSAWGEYGKGFGKGKWWYPDRDYGWELPHITAGIPMNPFMWSAAQEMRMELNDIAREVFKT